ncbi:MAG: NAD(P)-dependent oxidoreductase [Clostridia bacterium]|nr:NAD(P)-dependent oxidoreductase [Clostridia bacterium]
MPHVLVEAERCLQCKKPRCREGCPIKNPIPQFIRMLKEGKIKEAGNLVFTNNPLSIVCSLVCPHEKFCEGHCIMGIKSTPVHISTIEQYIADYNLDMLDIYSSGEYEGKVGIIGGGPAGIAMAFYMARRGYDVTIYEASERIGGILRYGIPDFRLPSVHIDRLERQLRSLGVKIHPNTLIGPVTTVPDLFRDGFDALFMSTGVWRPNKMNIKGESLSNVHYAINYLKSSELYNLGRDVVVIGAGNVAMDAARTSMRSLHTQNVTVLYRRDEADMPCRKEEYEYTRMDGVQFEFFTQVDEFTEDGVWVHDTREPIGQENRRFIPCNSSIVAISQGPQSNVVSTESRIRLDHKGLVITDENMQTTMEGVYASGDVVTGAKTVVEAEAAAKRCANAMHNYIQRKKNPDWQDEELYAADILDQDMTPFLPRG